MLKQLARLTVVVATLAIAWRWAFESVLTVDVRDHISVDVPSRKVFRIMADVEIYFHKIHPLYVEPLTLVDRYMRDRKIIEWKFKGKPLPHSVGLLADMVESELVLLSNMYDSHLIVNASNWLDFSSIVLHVEPSDTKTTLTCHYRLYFSWLGKLLLQGTLIENSKKYQRQMLENVKSLAEGDQ